MPDPSQRFGDLLIELNLVTQAQVAEGLALHADTGQLLGEVLVSLGYLTRSQLQRSLATAITRGGTVLLDRPPIGEILIGLQFISESQLNQALTQQRQDPRRLGEILISQGVTTDQRLFEALGVQSRMAQREKPAPKRAPTGEVPLVNGRRVVVVDDSQLACNLVREGLTEHGFDVIAFTDPLLALERVDALKPDLVLTDLEMPGIDGTELCRRLKAAVSRQVPVIILTANDADAARVGLLREGADDYVNKSASMAELAARIDSVLRRSQQTERMRRLFARYTSDAVVAEVLRSGDVVLSGEKRIVTVLFADLRNFTALAESLQPEEVMRLLNEVLGGLADVVLEWGGTLDKFLGDGLMAVWGAPGRHENDGEAAVSAALQMQTVIAAHNQGRGARPKLELGIGLNSGPVIAGSIGSQRRTEYTCIGDTVNVASRLCALAAAGEILLGEQTAQALRPLAPLEMLAPVRVKGKTQPVPLARVTPQLIEALGQRRRF